ncbi:hypothetical protein Pfo_010720 [Paulownia fortunei]|nr:hypothetical protein Pfo_010720 [Paulownia fortunei]
MENSTKKSGGVEIPKRNRSLDLKSLYKSRVSAVGESEKKLSEENDQENVKKKKKRSRKEVSLSCFESDAKKSRKEDVNGVKPELGFSQKLSGGSKGLHGISLALGENGNAFNFPKRPRGLVGRKKLETDQVSEPLRLPNSVNSVDRAGAFNGKVIKPEDEAVTSDQIVELVTLSADNNGASNSKYAGKVVGASNSKSAGKVGGASNSKSAGNVDGASNSKSAGKVGGALKSKSAGKVGGASNSKSAGKVGGSNSKIKQKADSKSTDKGSSSNVKLKRKAGADELKESRNDRSCSVQHFGKEDSVAVNNGDTSSKKRRGNSRKKKDVDGGEASKKKSEPSVGSSVSDSLFVDFDEDDDDEEKLEQNAARMLSSRFDPSCTGFSSRRKSSVSQTADGLSFPVSSSRVSFSRQANSCSAVDSTSADDKNRALRPKREDKSKGTPRKRRHFYEIHPRDLDPHWFLNRRIKVFWPLDESWYYGLVNDYHPECKLHHIKYDDRDEEWIDLQEEKFKLLLLPSDVPGKVKSKKVSPGDNDVHKGETVLSKDDDSSMGNYLDSEPIALWLARSSQRGKSLPKSLKTQRSSHMELPMVSSLSSEKTDNLNGNVADSKRTRSNPDFGSTVADKLVVSGLVYKSLLGTTKGNHVVYARKKLQRKGDGFGSLSRDIKAHESASGIVTPLAPVTVSLPTTAEDNFYEFVDSDKQLWSIDHQGLLRLNVVLVESKEFRFQICLPVQPISRFSLGTGDFWLFRNILMLQHGVMLTTSPAVILEMLFIDSYLGLRFLLFEGCMKQALAFVFLILIVFSQPDEHVNGDMQSPVTSIRLRLSSVQDPRKHHVFAFHSFSRLLSSKWVCLDSKLLQHCLLIKQLPVSECTYDNIKELECGSLKQRKPHVGLELPSNTGINRKFVPGILPMGVSKEACNTRISQSPLTFAAKLGKVPQFALSFSAAPTFFLTLHLRLLMENSFSWGNFNHHDALCSPEILENGSRPDAECAQFEPSVVAVQDIIAEHKIGTLETEAPAFKGLASSNEDLVADVALVSNVEKVDSSENLHMANPDDAGSAGYFKEFKGVAPEVIAPSHQCEANLHERSIVSFPSVPTSTASPTFNPRSDSGLGGMIVDIPSCDQVDIPLDGKGCISRQASDVGWNVNEGFVHSPNPTGSRCSWQGGRSSSISPLGDLSPIWPDGSPKFMRSGFSNGPKKPHTHVQYTLPGAGYDFSTKQKMQNQSALPCKRIRRASLKRISDGSMCNQKNFELLACGSNVLVTHGDKGWRECGALIALEVADHNEWRLAVKLSGNTRYSYKVKHILQPGSTNRYSHAMLWKGGKDWVLEFPDRSQWMLFKEMHEECYNRNIRAASVKNIPIPGVRPIDENDDYGTEVPFVRNCMMYFRQVQTDAEMAMDPSHILYDMDSDDEQWLMANKICTDENRCQEISEEFFEKTMDMFEKVSYVQHRNNFTDAELQELVIGMGSVEAAKVIYEHWREKRGRKAMPLIRHLQPPLWERYQQQLKEWEHTVSRGNSSVSVGIQKKVPTPEKPPMFAFCLKPRGLDVPNKSSKQRSHRKFPVSAHLHAASRDRDSPLVFGRRSNGHTFANEEVLYTSSVNESFDVSPSLQTSMKVLSPRDAHFSLSTDLSESNRNLKVYKNKPRKLGSDPSSNNQQTMSYNKRTIGNRKRIQQWNMHLPELSSQRHYYFEGPHRQGVEQLDGSNLHEFQLRDASGAAKHALSMAKLKKEKAQRLAYSADLAIQKAVVALMTAEAMKAANENSNGGN